MSIIECHVLKGVFYEYLPKPQEKHGTFQTGSSYFIIAIPNHFDILQLEKGDAYFFTKGRENEVN